MTSNSEPPRVGTHAVYGTHPRAWRGTPKASQALVAVLGSFHSILQVLGNYVRG